MLNSTSLPPFSRLRLASCSEVNLKVFLHRLLSPKSESLEVFSVSSLFLGVPGIAKVRLVSSSGSVLISDSSSSSFLTLVSATWSLDPPNQPNQPEESFFGDFCIVASSAERLRLTGRPSFNISSTVSFGRGFLKNIRLRSIGEAVVHDTYFSSSRTTRLGSARTGLDSFNLSRNWL